MLNCNSTAWKQLHDYCTLHAYCYTLSLILYSIQAAKYKKLSGRDMINLKVLPVYRFSLWVGNHS